MSKRMGIRAAATMAMALAAFACMSTPGAQAVDIIESQEPGGIVESPNAGFQAGTCTLDPCSAQTRDRFFTQAAGHAPAGFTQITAKHHPEVLNGEMHVVPDGTLKTLLVDLPAGLSVNPQATPQCPQLVTDPNDPEGFPICPANTVVGFNHVIVKGTDRATTIGAIVPIYNMVPRAGEPALFAFSLPLAGNIFLNAGIAWEGDYHEYFTIHAPSIEDFRLLSDRLVLDGTLGQSGAGGALLTNPSTCDDPEVEPFKRLYTTTLHADSYEESVPGNDYDLATPAPPSAAFLSGSEEVLSPLPKGAKPENCGKVPFQPSTSADFDTNQADSPAGATIEIKVPFNPAAPIYNSNVKEARLTLPRGMGINPSAADGLQACSDEQFGKGSRRPVACPAAAKIGTVALDTPPLPDGTLTGNAYLGKQLSRDPASGEEYRIFLVAESAVRGVSVRLIGNLEVDPQTGQITTVVHDAPQVPFKSVRVKLDGGARATLTSPPTCGPNLTTRAMTAWSKTPDNGPQEKGFTLSSAPGGGPCVEKMAERPFSPAYSAGPGSTKAKLFTPYLVRIVRGEGQQELKGVDVTLPPGATAKLAGVPYCPEGAIAAAAARAGGAEMASASCPAKSRVGSSQIVAGSGPSPLRIDGDVFLAGPYKGAPLSLAIVTPALAGPFDLGTAIVRVALAIDPVTAQIHLLSDSIPDVFGGTKLSVRSITVDVNKPDFTLNGTSCSQLSVTGALAGGGADPTNPGAFSSVPVSVPSAMTDCNALKFKPKLKLRLLGATKRGQHPSFRASVKTRPQDANLARASVALPHSLFLDQASLSAICTRVQYAAHACPKRSIYGRARAFTPLLDKPLEGRVYLRSSDNPLPDLVAHLEGQINVDVVGSIDNFRGGIRTTFRQLPDVPLRKFVMTLPGGKRGLLVASESLCGRPVKAAMRLKGQNGKKISRPTTLRTSCGKSSGGRGARGK